MLNKWPCYLLNVILNIYFFNFSDMADSSVKFDKNGDGIARYTIYNYQKRLSDGATDYKVIGKWMDGLGKY